MGETDIEQTTQAFLEQPRAPEVTVQDQRGANRGHWGNDVEIA